MATMGLGAPSLLGNTSESMGLRLRLISGQKGRSDRSIPTLERPCAFCNGVYATVRKALPDKPMPTKWLSEARAWSSAVCICRGDWVRAWAAR